MKLKKLYLTTNWLQPPSNLVIGVTNPFFNTAIEHWPHIVRVGRQQLRYLQPITMEKEEKRNIHLEMVARKPDGTLITAHGNHAHPSQRAKAGLSSKSNVLFEAIQVQLIGKKGCFAGVSLAYVIRCPGCYFQTERDGCKGQAVAKDACRGDSSGSSSRYV